MQYKHCLTLLFGLMFTHLYGQTNHASKLSNFEQKADSIMLDAIQKQAFPGAQIMIYKSDSILLHKSYGFHTYDSIQNVTNDHLYDLASVTKILAGTLAFMKLYDLYDINLQDKVSKYIPRLSRSNKSSTLLLDVLSHSSGWIPSIRHHDEVYGENGKLKPRSVSKKKSKRFPYQISDSLFVFKNYHKIIERRIKKSELGEIGKYKYSGLWFYLLPQMIESISGLSLEEFLDIHFYNPLSIERLTFNPLKKFPKEEIVPTEIDTLFRKTLVHGWVHDEGAALMSGISGNAGLFANTESIAVLLKLLLNNGTYNGKEYLKKQTIELFTKYAFDEGKNRRGLGFDKPTIPSDKPQSYPSRLVSGESYGHSGFTGTLVWVDPKYDYFMIFLSNRVHPSREQSAIYETNVRSKLLDLALIE